MAFMQSYTDLAYTQADLFLFYYIFNSNIGNKYAGYSYFCILKNCYIFL
jgi:hypothetical protein